MKSGHYLRYGFLEGGDCMNVEKVHDSGGNICATFSCTIVIHIKLCLQKYHLENDVYIGGNYGVDTCMYRQLFFCIISGLMNYCCIWENTLVH